MEPLVTIELKEYDRLKDLEFQFKIFIDKVEVASVVEPNYGPGPMKIGYISEKDFKYHIKNILNLDDLVIKKGN